MSTAIRAETVTLPAAASIVGVSPFYSDVRIFNTSYTAEILVTARYRCFLGACAGAPVLHILVGPRESAAFDDMVADVLHSPDSGGGIEFEFDGDASQIVVTSRLYSTAPQPTVGMFIPGVHGSEAHSRTVLTSIRNGGAPPGFRANVGVFNPGNAAVSVTFRIYDDVGVQRGSPVNRTLGGHSGAQVSGIFFAAGTSDFHTENAVITVEATSPVFSYAAVIDNATSDPYFVFGAADGAGATTAAPNAHGPDDDPLPTGRLPR